MKKNKDHYKPIKSGNIVLPGYKSFKYTNYLGCKCPDLMDRDFNDWDKLMVEKHGEDIIWAMLPDGILSLNLKEGTAGMYAYGHDA